MRVTVWRVCVRFAYTISTISKRSSGVWYSTDTCDARKRVSQRAHRSHYIVERMCANRVSSNKCIRWACTRPLSVLSVCVCFCIQTNTYTFSGNVDQHYPQLGRSSPIRFSNSPKGSRRFVRMSARVSLAGRCHCTSRGGRVGRLRRIDDAHTNVARVCVWHFRIQTHVAGFV